MKKKLLVLLAVLLLFLIIWVVSPHNSAIDLETEAVEYKLDDPAHAVPRTVILQGTYTWRLFGKDEYRGTLAVSGLEATQPPNIAYASFFEGNYASVSYQNKQYLYRAGELSALYVTPHFEQAVLLLYEVWDNDDGGQTASWSGDNGRFLAFPAKDLTAAMELFAQLTGIPSA